MHAREMMPVIFILQPNKIDLVTLWQNSRTYSKNDAASYQDYIKLDTLLIKSVY